MRRALAALILTLCFALCLASAAAASFSGVFVDQQNGVSISIQEAADGTLSGVVDTANGQFQLQGQVFQQDAAYGMIGNDQGQLGFQAYLSADGSAMQFALYGFDANNQPVPQGELMLARSGGATGQTPGQFPTQTPVQTPGQFPVQTPGQTPGQFPTQTPVQTPGQFPTQTPGQIPGQFPPQTPGFATPPTSVPNTSGWVGTFVGDAGSLVLSVSGSQGQLSGYVQSQGQRYPFQAHIDDPDILHGQFQAGGTTYEFWAQRQGTDVMLEIGQTTYVMQQTSAQPTP